MLALSLPRPTWSCRKWSFNPNILAYWQDKPTRFHDIKEPHARGTGTGIIIGEHHRGRHFANPFLGVEINSFLEAQIVEDLKFFAVGSLFIPGKYYQDIKGHALNKQQRTFLENIEKSKIEPIIVNDRVPLMGDNPGLFINVGLEYKF